MNETIFRESHISLDEKGIYKRLKGAVREAGTRRSIRPQFLLLLTTILLLSFYIFQYRCGLIMSLGVSMSNLVPVVKFVDSVRWPSF